MRMLKRAAVCVAVAGTLLGLALSASGQDKKPLEKNGKDVPPPPPVPDTPEAPAPFVPSQVVPAPQYGFPTLNWNYYYPVPAAEQTMPQIPARLYLCPRPVPPYVGYTYIAYPPFQPHEWLWPHQRAYYRVHPGGGMTTTSIWWTCE
jgi:hypothetical protein